MFIDFDIGRDQSQKGFSANIHYGIEFKDAYNLHKSNIWNAFKVVYMKFLVWNILIHKITK